MSRLRQLLTKHRIPWRDHGPNVGKNHVNITCPKCGNADKGFHGAINEKSLQFYCFRNPHHATNYVAYILKLLKIPEREYTDLIPSEGIKEVVVDDRDYSAWHSFDPASTDPEAIAYLQSRLLLNPVLIANSCDLKTVRQGEWCGRLLIGLTQGWVGRAMRKHLDVLRYKAHTSNDGFFLYKNKSTSAIIVEGPLDAIKIVASSSQFDVIAKCRMNLSSAILVHLRNMEYESIYNCPDSSVPYSQHNSETRLIRSYCPASKVQHLPLPQHVKDFGELEESAARRMLVAI